MTDLDKHQHDALRIDLGAYVLGALDAQEAGRVAAHLADCADCRAEHDELVPTAVLLADLKGVSEPVPLPEGLDDRIVSTLEAEAARSRRTRWLRSAGLAAVAGAAAAAVLVAGLVALGPDDGPDLPIEAVSVSVPARGITADADLVAHTWGLEVKLSGSGFAEGRRYRVAVLGADGTRYPAGEFVGTGDRPMLCNLSSAVLRESASGFEVLDGRGRVVVRSRFDA